MFWSCNKDFNDDNIDNQKKTKEIPNLKLNFIKTKSNPKSLEPLLREYSRKIKRTQNPNARGEVLTTLEGSFGTVKLDQVLEVNEGTYKTESFEVEEAVENPNIYYNLIIDKSENIWLYKIEKLTQPIDSFPINSELVTRMQLDSNLNMSTPCDSIIYPPFGYYSSEIIPNTGGGGPTSGGWNDNPPPSGTGGSLSTGGFFNTGGGSASTGGGGGGGGVVDFIAAIGDAFVGAWNWIIDLFGGDPKPGENTPCNCGHRSAVVIDDIETPCGDLGYIAVIPQDEYVDKIINFQNYFSVLHNNDNVFLYQNHEMVDYIDNLLTLHPNNFELHSLFPEVISAVRLNKITWDFGKDFINQSNIQDGLELDLNKSFKSPFFIDMNSVSGNTPEEVKFREVYNLLMQSPKFKELFHDLFNTTSLFNAKFTIENIPQQFGPNNYIKGKCKLSYTNGHPVPFNNIVIDRNFILTKSKSEIVTTILHECIHAYLNIKFLNPNIGMSINNINNLDFQGCINEYYANFSGTQTQHSFFVDYMIPTMVEILNDVKNDIFTAQQISAVEYPASNALIYGVPQTNPSVKDYNVVLPWDWTNYFTHLCFSGLESSTSYLSIYPHGSPNELNSQQYISIGTFIFN